LGSTPPEELAADAANVKPAESRVEPVKDATAIEQDGRPRFSWLGGRGAAKIGPKQEPSVDPATEALRTALAALVTTGIPNRDKTG
jgi:hypothetical protein